MNGQLVRELVAGEYPAGEHTLMWHGENAQGILQANGVYFCRLQSDGQTIANQRIVMLR